MAEMKDFRSRGNGLFEELIQLILGGRYGKLQTRDFNLFSPHALIPRCQHARIILLRRDDFVSGRKIETVLHDLH